MARARSTTAIADVLELPVGMGLLRRRADGSTMARADVLRQLARAYASRSVRLTDDDGQSVEARASDPFVALPPMPSAMGRHGIPIDFLLSAEERQFMRKHFLGIRRLEPPRPACWLAWSKRVKGWIPRHRGPRKSEGC